MNSATFSQLGTIHALLATVPAAVVGQIEKTAGGLEAQLLVAERMEKDLASAELAMLGQLQAAREVAVARAGALRAELNKAAVNRVLDLLKTGDLTLESLAGQIGAVAPAVPACAPQPIPAAAATPAAAPAPAAPSVPSPEIRVNLALQAGYLNDVKYRDEASGLAWTGRGPTPKWLKALCVNGKTKDDFLVVKQAPAAPAAAPTPAPTPEATAPVAALSPDQPVSSAAMPAAAGSDAESVMTFDATDIDPELDSPVEGGGTVPGDDGIAEVLIGIEAMGTLTPFGSRISSAANHAVAA